MFFNRHSLIRAINNANTVKTICVYKELLAIWYKLIDQESINGTLLDGFYYYGKISDVSMSFYNIFC